MLNSPFPPIKFSQSGSQTAGQPIGELVSQALENPELISLAAGFVDPQTLPVKIVQNLTNKIFSDDRVGRDVLQYGTTAGRLDLRDLIFEKLVKADLPQGSPLTASQVFLTAGSNQLLFLLGQALLDPGDIVLAAAPTYFVFLGTLGQLGAEVVGVAADADGMDPLQLEATLEALRNEGKLSRVKAIYLVSYFDNPAGSNLSQERRERIVELAKSYSRDHRIMILSDEAYRPLRYEGEDLPSMTSADADSETVIAAGTFSKSFSPGIRVGWGVMPQTVIESITALKNNMDFGAPNLNQCIVHRAMESGVYDTHVESLQHAYRLKRDAMLAAADEYLGDIPGVSWRRPQGGLYIWLTLPAEMPSSPGSPLFDLAVKRGVLYVPGQYCFPKCGVPVAENTIRLSFGVEQPERLRDGMRLLSECIREILHI